jgi:hypothetical protein
VPLAFPHLEFIESLESKRPEHQAAASRVALDLAIELRASIASELTDGTLRQIKPYRHWLQRFFG